MIIDLKLGYLNINLVYNLWQKAVVIRWTHTHAGKSIESIQLSNGYPLSQIWKTAIWPDVMGSRIIQRSLPRSIRNKLNGNLFLIAVHISLLVLFRSWVTVPSILTVGVLPSVFLKSWGTLTPLCLSSLLQFRMECGIFFFHIKTRFTLGRHIFSKWIDE